MTDSLDSRHAESGVVLVVDDDELLAPQLVRALATDGHLAEATADPEVALHRCFSGGVDLALLDWGLRREMNGLDIARALRAREVPIALLMLTARNLEEDEVEAYSAGVDDFLVKPVGVRKLLAKVRLWLRTKRWSRTQRGREPVAVRVGRLRLDLVMHTAEVEGIDAALTPKEVSILFALATAPDMALTGEALRERVWGGTALSSVTLPSHISRLRAKLGAAVRLLHKTNGDYALVP